MKRIVIVIFSIILLGLIIYLVYVRGFGVSPKLSSPITIRVEKKTYKAHWEIKKPMPTARSEVAAAAIGSRIFVVGGIDGFGKTLATVEVYDTISDIWTKLVDLPQPRHHAAAAVLDGVLYIIGGMSDLAGKPAADVFVFYEGSNEWQMKASLPTPRGALATALIDRKIYAIGGIGPLGVTSELAVFEPDENKWEIKTQALNKRDHLAAASINEKLYVAGGRVESLTKNLALLEIYDPVLDVWTQATPMPLARGGIGGTGLEGLFVVAGGEHPLGTFSDVDAFDPKAKKWVSFPRLPTARHGLGVAAFGSMLFAIGGGTHPGLSVSGVNEAMYLTGE